jgi:hypothetical protein
MRRPLLLALSFVLAATAAFADVPVLTTDGVLYSASRAEGSSLTITRRSEGAREALVVPTTDDSAIESDASLTYDGKVNLLFVTWRRSTDFGDEILMASLNAAGEWSAPVTVVSSDSSIRIGGLQTAHTNGKDSEGEVTLVHAAWWRQSSQVAVPHYALVAFDGQKHVSTATASLLELAEVRVAVDEKVEDTGSAKFPPLAIEALQQEADIVYGDTFTTKLTRVRVVPRVPSANARLWKPGGKDARRMPSARLISSTAEPVQAFIVDSRVVLYTATASRFGYVIFSGNQWSPVRHIAVDAAVTPDKLVTELRKAVERSTTSSDAVLPGF